MQPQLWGQVSKACLICKATHAQTLLSCPQLPQYIPDAKSFKKLPPSICQICLNCNGKKSPACHEKIATAHYTCKVSKKSILLCEQCTEHKPLHNWMKSFHNPSMGLKNMSLYRQSKTAVTNAASYKCSENIIKINKCHIGQSQCPTEVLAICLAMAIL